MRFAVRNLTGMLTPSSECWVGCRESNWWRLALEPGSKKIARVLVDPERVYFIDANMADNQWYDRSDRVAPARWGERAWSQYAHLLHWYSTLGG